MGPTQVNHFGQLPSVTIGFNLRPGFALGDAVSQIQTAAAETLPSTVTVAFQGAAQAFQDSFRGLGLVLLMAIVVIYIVLGVLYESFTHPLTILSGLPAAGLGALLTLMLFGVELNLYAFVGVIMLVGLVKKNGIMMVDFAVEAQKLGKTPTEAIHEACLVRFRPIMMTTMAALVGTLPIALGLGAGAESRRPLGLAVVGGLLVSQLLTLYITPVYYSYIEGLRLRLARRREPPRAARAGEGRGDLEPHEVVRFVEPAAAGHVAGAGPLAPDDGQHDAAVVEARLDRLHEVLPRTQGIDVTKHPRRAEAPFERFAQPAGVARRVLAAVADEGSGHLSPGARASGLYRPAPYLIRLSSPPCRRSAAAVW